MGQLPPGLPCRTSPKPRPYWGGRRPSGGGGGILAHSRDAHSIHEVRGFILASPPSPAPGDGAKKPGQPCCGGQRVLRDQGPLCGSAPGSGRGYQRLGHPQTQPGGDLEVSTPAGISGSAWHGLGTPGMVWQEVACPGVSPIPKLGYVMGSQSWTGWRRGVLLAAEWG